MVKQGTLTDKRGLGPFGYLCTHTHKQIMARHESTLPATIKHQNCPGHTKSIPVRILMVSVAQWIWKPFFSLLKFYLTKPVMLMIHVVVHTEYYKVYSLKPLDGSTPNFTKKLDSCPHVCFLLFNSWFCYEFSWVFLQHMVIRRNVSRVVLSESIIQMQSPKFWDTLGDSISKINILYRLSFFSMCNVLFNRELWNLKYLKKGWW